MDVNNFEQLKKELLKIAQGIIGNDIVPKVRKIQQDKVHSTVYDAYKNPTMYERRKNNGGLSDIANMWALPFYENNAVGYTVINDTKGDGKIRDNLVTLVEYGDGVNGLFYKYAHPLDDEREADYFKPRPFIQNTVNEIRRTDVHIKLMKQGFTSRGFKVQK